jgi:hypothetical protein
MGNPWKPKFVPAHRKPKDRLRGAQLAPVQRVEAVLCRCSHARLLHQDEGKCLNKVCGCLTYRERSGEDGCCRDS